MLRARLVRLRLRKGTRPLRQDLLDPASALAHRKACAQQAHRNRIVQPERRKAAPVAHPARVVDPAVRRRGFRSAQALAAPAVATTKLP